MAHVLINDGGDVEYPYDLAKLRTANPGTSFPRELGEWAMEWNVYPVAATPRPAYDLNFNVVEGTPALVNGIWKQVWEQIPASAEEIARRTQTEADNAAAAQVKIDAFVRSFVAMSPAELDAYIDATSANLAQMRTLVKRMAKMLLIIAKRELK